jgi:Protein of unknown function (DUF4245)
VARTKRQPTPTDMIRSLAVILVPLLVITFLLTRTPRDHPVETVDWGPVLATARSQSPYPVLGPVNLPEGWRATRVSWVRTGEPALNGEPSVRNSWQLGFLDPDNVYVGLQQGDLKADLMISDATRDGQVDGQSNVASTTWERRVSPDDRTRSLVLATPAVTTIVSADAGYDLLEAYVGTLESK